MNAENYLSILNPEQLAAVLHEGSPLLILAGAGSGKTRVITTKIAYLIAEKNVRPDSILAVTFTNKAANEMRDRASHLEPRSQRTLIRTFHSFGATFLRTYAPLIGLESGFIIYDDDDCVSLLAKVTTGVTRQQISNMTHKIARAKDYMLTPEDPLLDQIDSSPEFRELYTLYEERLRKTGNVDFGDLIMLPAKILTENEEVRRRVQTRYSVIMVDEYQDSNVAQFALLKALSGEHTYLCVVGDDDQSIYKFRGAEVQNIVNFPDYFPNTTIIKLERNYRSVNPILTLAGQVVENNTSRLGKTLSAERSGGKKPKLIFLNTQDDEVVFCSELILNAAKKGVPFTDWAILYRTNAQSLGFETEFIHRKIPYTIVGSLKFYEREEVKDTLAWLSLLVNPRDEVAFSRMINKPARGIGAVTQEKIRQFALQQENFSLPEAARSLLKEFAKKAKTGIGEFLDAYDNLKALLPPSTGITEAHVLADLALPDETQSKEISNGNSLSQFIEKVIIQSGLIEYHQAQDEIAGTQKVANMNELINAAALYQYTMDGLLLFLERIELDSTAVKNAEAEPSDAVTLITLHNTKGLEFPRVIITGIEAGIFPRDDKTAGDLEEERRLFYVGITRAKDDLYLTTCASRRLYGQYMYNGPSPFLREIQSESIDILGKPPAGFLNRMGKKNVSPDENADAVSSEKQKHIVCEEQWSKGQKLYHDEYGYGIIIKTGYSEDEYVITVQFETGETQRFMPSYQAKALLRIDE